MAQVERTADPYDDLVRQILRLGYRIKGWDSYDADQADPDAIDSAIGLVHRFSWYLLVPRPDVGLASDGAVVMRWLLPDREIEIRFDGGDTGEFSVLRRPSDDVIVEGSLRQVDVYNDIVERDVLGYSPH